MSSLCVVTGPSFFLITSIGIKEAPTLCFTELRQCSQVFIRFSWLFKVCKHGVGEHRLLCLRLSNCHALSTLLIPVVRTLDYTRFYWKVDIQLNFSCSDFSECPFDFHYFKLMLIWGFQRFVVLR